MSQTSNDGPKRDQEQQPDPERRAIADLEDELDEQAEGDGLAAEAGRSEEHGLAEG